VRNRFLPLLRRRSFRNLAGAMSIDALGGRITHMLLIALIPLANPGRVFAYSEGSLVIGLPPVLLAAFVGVIVDRWDRRTALMSSLFAQGVVLLLAPLLFIATGSLVPAWPILFLFFAADVLKNTSGPALLPAIVAPDEITTANSISFTLARALTVVGMVGGGYLVRWTGWRWSFTIAAATRIAAGLLILAIPRGKVKVEEKVEIPSSFSTSTSTFTSFLAGSIRRFAHDVATVLRLVRRNRYVAFVMFSIVVSMAITGIAYTILLFLIQQVLKLGTAGVGIYLGILAGGMFIGALVLGFVGERVSKTRVVVLSFAAVGLLFLVGPVMINIWYMAIVALVAGLAFSWIGIAQTSILQTRVALDVQGRIFATREFFSNVALLATTFIIGLISIVAHLKLLLVIVGLGLIIVSGLGYWIVRGLDDQPGSEFLVSGSRL
jgi:NRE family putative nickel resistance protein-like MFS transporter